MKPTMPVHPHLIRWDQIQGRSAVIRGDSWLDNSILVRSSNRDHRSPDDAVSAVVFGALLPGNYRGRESSCGAGARVHGVGVGEGEHGRTRLVLTET